MASLDHDTTICKGASVRLHLNASGGDSSYTYAWLTGVTGTGFTDTTVAPGTTTTYSVKVSDGCSTEPDTAYIQVFVRPELTIQPPADTTVCTKGNAIMRPTATGGDSSYIYQWKYTRRYC